MKGLELSRQYWQQAGKPALAPFPELLSSAAAGLVGEGSECFGYDDELSRDHDWGVGFCLWLSREQMAAYGRQAKEIYAALPREFMGFSRKNQTPETAGRVGVLEIESFYQRFLGISHPPHTLQEWRFIPEAGLAAATNGAVFQDPPGTFSAFRRALLGYYPEDLRRKKLAMRCALAAQSGQYNYPRCIRRGEKVAALLALSQFLEHVQYIVYMLNRQYRPFYKWAQRGMRQLPTLGQQIAALSDCIASDPENAGGPVEMISSLLIEVLCAQGLSEADSDFLLPHAESIQAHITDPSLRALHLMSE